MSSNAILKIHSYRCSQESLIFGYYLSAMHFKDGIRTIFSTQSSKSHQLANSNDSTLDWPVGVECKRKGNSVDAMVSYLWNLTSGTYSPINFCVNPGGADLKCLFILWQRHCKRFYPTQSRGVKLSRSLDLLILGNKTSPSLLHMSPLHGSLRWA